MTQYGAGPALDEDFDFRVAPSGDLDFEDGITELEKDLALQTAEALEERIGQAGTQNTQANLAKVVRDAILADSRIIAVGRENLTVRETGRNEYQINAVAQTSDGQQSLVFEV